MHSVGFRARNIAITLAAGVTLGACTNLYSGYGYNGYGYNGLSVGVGTGHYYDPYYGSYYGSYYGRSPYWGWYDGFYYPGTGYYVYDRYRRPYRWSSTQQKYWTDRKSYWRERGIERLSRRELQSNSSDFQRQRVSTVRRNSSVQQSEKGITRLRRADVSSERSR